jgi:DNA-binding response OmpR family regulator
MSERPKVLIVDDEPDVLLTLRMILESEGFDPLLAADGETALRRVDEERPDLVVLDIMMPVLDGWFVLAELGGRPTRPKVVVCSAKSGDGDRTRARDLGADEYVTKPFEPDDLVLVIRDALGHTRDRASA